MAIDETVRASMGGGHKIEILYNINVN